MNIGAEPPVVVGVDAGPESLHAVDWAAREAVRRGVPLCVVHAGAWPPAVFQDPGSSPAAVAAQRAEAAQPELEVRVSTPEGAAAAVLIGQSRRAGLVVVGRRCPSTEPGLVTASVGVRVAARSRCPVVIVPAVHHTDGPADGCVVAAIDGSPDSDAAAAFAFEHAAGCGAGLLAVHAYHWNAHPGLGPLTIPAVFDPETLRRAEERRTALALTGWREKYPAVPVTTRTVWGQADTVLARQSGGAVLVAVGARSIGGYSGLLLGSVSHRLATHAACPVAVVRATSR